MTMTLDGTSGLTTPGVVNTAGETIATTLAVTGVSTFAAGTALLPALTTTGDTNTGVWFPAADTVAASTGGTERIRINSAGIVTAPYIPAFHVTQSTGASGFAANSIANWNTVTTNNGSHFKTTAGTGQNQRFTAPVDGYYHFNCLMLSNSGTQLFFSIRKNSVAITGTNIESYVATQHQSCTSTTTVFLATNDFVEVFMGSNPGYGAIYANFNGFLIG